MLPQVSKQDFAQALRELGHDPEVYQNRRLSLDGVSELFEISEDNILEAIEMKQISAHYDYRNDTIWIDALEAAHFYYCVRDYEEMAKKAA